MTAYDSFRHHRRTIRLQGYDYSQAGGYFITVCALHRENLFGRVVDAAVLLNEFGMIVAAVLQDIPGHFDGVSVDTFVVMPNHVHAIIVIADVENVVAVDARDVVAADGRDVGAKHFLNCKNASPLPRDAQPGDAQPRDAQPGDAQPRDAQPGDAQPGDAQPHTAQPRGTQSRSLAAIVQNFKSVSARTINAARGSPGVAVWQRNYYEHIIRNASTWDTIRRYIADNPANWATDAENPHRTM